MSESSGKSRADKLDEAFLFLISLTSVIFMIVQAFSGALPSFSTPCPFS
jgi:hypothetical protein